MPKRMIRDWTDSLKLDGISADAERLFTRLIMKADDYGRFHADPRLVKANCFPLLETIRPNDLDRWLSELSTRQLILRYEAEGRKLLAIVNYGQRLKESKHKFPPIPGQENEWLPTDEHFREVPGSSGKFPVEEKGREEEVEENPPNPQGGDVGATKHVLPKGCERWPIARQKATRVNCNNALMTRVGKLLGRREGTLWTVAEALALQALNPQPGEIDALEPYYWATIEPEKDIRRRDLLTLLNNWNGELDRARGFKPKP